jgi:hypothetical protein
LEAEESLLSSFLHLPLPSHYEVFSSLFVSLLTWLPVDFLEMMIGMADFMVDPDFFTQLFAPCFKK